MINAKPCSAKCERVRMAHIAQEMVAAVEMKLSEAAQRMLVPAWPRAAVAVSPVAIQAQGRRFGRAVRLLRSIAAFEAAMPSAPLRALALDTIFSRQVRSSSLLRLAVMRCTR